MTAVAVAQAPRAETLADAIALAYQTNPGVLSQRAQLRALDETYVQARAGLRPTVGLYADASRQDVEALVQNDTDYGLSVTQPLYTGGRVTAQLNAAKGDILSGRETLRQAESNLLQSVIRAYVDVRRDQQAYIIREQNLENLTTQVRNNQVRFEAGDLTRTDVAQSQASQAAARALLAQARAQLEISRANYASAVGHLPGSLEPEPALPATPANLDAAFLLVEQNNATVRAAKYDEKASRERIALAKAQAMPQLSLRGAYGYENNRSNYLPQLFGRSLSGSVSFSQPLFAGGAIQSQVRQASERNIADRMRVQQAVRDANLRVSRAWSQFAAAQAGISASQAEVDAATVAYEGTEIERKAGQRTTLEVLTAEQVKRDAELNLVNARHDVYVAQADMLDALGLLQARSLVPATPIYNPETSFDRVSGKGFVPWEPILAAADGVAVPKVKPLADLETANTPLPEAKGR